MPAMAYKIPMTGWYLHWWDEAHNRFSTEQESIECGHGDIAFPDELPACVYPGGYKFWTRRCWADAPEWVKQVSGGYSERPK